MDFEPYEGTSDGRVKRTSNGSTVEIKQEPDVKEEPLDQVEMVSRATSARVDVAFDADLEVKWEVESDDEWDFEWNSINDPEYIKEEEVKCENKNEKKEKDSTAALSSSKSASNDQSRGNKNVPLSESKDNGKKAKPKRKRENQYDGKNQNQVKDTKKPTTEDARKHKCKFCNYAARYKSKLMIHERIHMDEKPFCCDICSKTFAQKIHLMQHKRIHGDQFTFRCSKCGHGFDFEQEKIDHENKCKILRLECELCKYSTQYKCSMGRHMLVHSGEKPHECSFCLKAFTEKTYLKRHLRTHRDELPFTCSKCGQRFADDESKQLHEKHCRNRLYECYLCGYKCFNKTKLKWHMEAKHIIKKSFECEVCHKKFTRNESLYTHFLSHGDQFPYQCSKCGCGFPEEDLKNKHQEFCRRRQYKCFLCKVIKPNEYKLKHHMLVYHTGDRLERPFQCEVCKARFTQKGPAKTHMKRVHGLEKNIIQNK